MYDELTKYPCRTMEDVQAKAMAQVRLEVDRQEDDEEYYRPSRKITTARIRDYKPYDRTSSSVEGGSNTMDATTRKFTDTCKGP